MFGKSKRIRELEGLLASTQSALSRVKAQEVRGFSIRPNYHDEYILAKSNLTKANAAIVALSKEVGQLKSALADAVKVKADALSVAERQHNIVTFAQQLMLTRFGMLANEALEEATIIYPEAK